MMEASLESSSKVMETSTAVPAQSEVDQQWQLQSSAAAVGCSFWQETGSDSRGSVAEAVPVPSNAIEALQTPNNEGTFLCLDCDMPLNIEMKKDHLLVCKSRQQDADKVHNDNHDMVPTSTSLERPLMVPGETISRPMLQGSAAEEAILPDDPGLIDKTDHQSGLMSGGPQIGSGHQILMDGTQLRPTLIATMTEDGIVVTTSPNGSLQLMEPVPNEEPPTITQHYVVAPVLTKMKSLPSVHVICQPNGKQCKVYTDEVENYKCQVCNFTTTNSTNLSNHKCILPSSKLKCSECDFVGESSNSLSRHIVAHKKTKVRFFKLQCPPKLDKFVEVRTVDSQEMFGCTECNFTSHLYLSIKHHTQTHTTEKPYRCDRCDYSCKLEGNLRNHQLIHDNDEVIVRKRAKLSKSVMKLSTDLPTFVCKVCDHMYSEEEERPNDHIDTHLKMDEDELSFRCNVCELSCDTLQEMRSHVRRHVSKWPQICRQCDYVCYKVSELRHHEKTHVRKLLECGYCDYKCKLRCNLKLHMKTDHSSKSVVRRLSSKTEKIEKLMEKTGKISSRTERTAAPPPSPVMTTRNTSKKAVLRCTQCDFVTNDRPTFEHHLKTHRTVERYECTLCDYSCKMLANFERHKSMHNDVGKVVKIK